MQNQPFQKKINFCYLTGKEIKKKEESLHDSDEVESLEHIIPNGIGGKIKSKTILNKGANKKLNELIDIPFVKIFNPFTIRLNFKRDRQNSPSIGVTSKKYIDTDFFIKEGKFITKKPIYDEEKNIIYAASEDIGIAYRNFLEKSGKLPKNKEVNLLDDLAGGFYIKFEMDDKVFKQGLAKISAGFATLKGIKRNNLRTILDFENCSFFDKIKIFVELPKTKEHAKIESFASLSKYYPAHILVLYGNPDDKILYCYVELFSTFQYYVILDDDYNGEIIHATYTYSLLNNQEIPLKDYILSIPGGGCYWEKNGTYRKITKSQLLSSMFVDFAQVKVFNHFKYNTLSNFTNSYYIKEKSKVLKKEYDKAIVRLLLALKKIHPNREVLQIQSSLHQKKN